MQNGEQDDPICLDNINLLHEDCGLRTSDEEDNFDSANLINHLEDGSLPTVGMQFDTAEDIKTSYKKHVVKYGFGVRIRTSKKDDNDHLCYLKLVCLREGKYMSQIPPELKIHLTQREKCPVCITTVKKPQAWIVRIVVHEHNHDISPTKSRLIHGNRRSNLKPREPLILMTRPVYI